MTKHRQAEKVFICNAFYAIPAISLEREISKALTLWSNIE